MKKIRFLLVALSCLTLCACGSEQASVDTDAQNPSSGTGTAQAEAAAEQEGKTGEGGAASETKAPETEPEEILPEGVQVTEVLSEETSHYTEYHYEVLPGKKARLVKMITDSRDRDQAVPEELDGYTVTEIGPEFLSDSGSVSHFMISGSVTNMDDVVL